MAGQYHATIPRPVLDDEDLTPNAKILYGRINMLVKKEGHCYASNGYLADDMNATKRAVQNWIHDLKQRGHIFIVREGGGDEDRHIYTRETYLELQGEQGDPRKGDRGATNSRSREPRTGVQEDNVFSKEVSNERESAPAREEQEKDIEQLEDPVAILEAAFPGYSAHNQQKEKLPELVDDLDAWREACTYWALGDYPPKSPRLLEKYREIVEEQQSQSLATPDSEMGEFK